MNKTSIIIMGQQTKSAHLLASSLGIKSGIYSAFGFLPSLIYLGIHIFFHRPYSLHFLILIYGVSLITSEVFFWNSWKTKISEKAKTKNWNVFLPNHNNLWIAASWAFLDGLVEVLLIRTVLNIQGSLIWAFFIIICSRAVGSLIQMILCDLLGRKKIVIFSLLTTVGIMWVLLLFQNTLSVKLLFSLLIVKGLLGNLATIARTVFADHMEISY